MLKLANQFWNLGRGDLPERRPVVALVQDVILATVFVGLAFLVRWLLGLIGSKVLIFAVCYPALLIVTLIAGFRAGLFALIISTLAFWWAFVPEYYSFTLPTTVDATNIWLYIVVGLAVLWISEQYRRSHSKLLVERARNELLVREMQHRTKNSLAVVSSIVSQSLKDLPDRAKAINGRLAALREGEESMWSGDRKAVPVRDLIAREFASYDASRLTLTGPDAEVGGELARTMCLVVHEFATNAVKYGAWSTPTGYVDVTWTGINEPTRLIWAERGGPPPRDGAKPGFGTFLIGRLLTQHRGRLDAKFTPTGVIWTATFAGHTAPP